MLCKVQLQYAVYLLEVVLGELVCDAEQLAAGMCVCEGPDAQTVRGIQLPLEELAAGLLDLSQLEQAGGREESLHIPLFHSHLGEGGGTEEAGNCINSENIQFHYIGHLCIYYIYVLDLFARVPKSFFSQLYRFRGTKMVEKR